MAMPLKYEQIIVLLTFKISERILMGRFAGAERELAVGRSTILKLRFKNWNYANAFNREPTMG